MHRIKLKTIAKWRIVRILFVLILAAVLALTVASYAIGNKYGIPGTLAAKMITRETGLSLIRAFTAIYDSAPGRQPVFEPGGYNPAIADEYKRIELVLNKQFEEKSLRLIDLRNEKRVSSRYGFAYQPSDDLNLVLLRKQYKLDEVVAGAKNELESLILLRNWTRSQFRRYDYQPLVSNFNAVEVLRNNIRNPQREPHKRHIQYRPCHFFPLLYSQVLLSMGYQPRLVRISMPEEKGYDGHGMVEVWSNQFRKWIVMDPDQNILYEKNGIPLNMLEIHDDRSKSLSEVKILQGIHTAGDFDPAKQINVQHMIRYHSYLQIIDMRNDWLTNHYFSGHPLRSDHASLFWVDKEMPPVFTLQPKTSNIDDFYWTLDQTEIRARKDTKGIGSLSVMFKTFTPNFKHFEVRIDNAKMKTLNTPFLKWDLHLGKNRLAVRSVNQLGVSGVDSWVEVELDAPGIKTKPAASN
jgi:hypothetical protein